MFDTGGDYAHDPAGLARVPEVSVSLQAPAIFGSLAVMTRLAICAALLAIVPGCMGAQLAALELEVQRQREQLSELRSNQAAQRVQFDEFRNRLLVLQDKLESERIAALRAAQAQGPEEMPALPRVVVESRSPAPAESSRGAEPAAPTGAPRSVMIGADGVPRVVDSTDPGTAPAGGQGAAPSTRRGVAPAGPRADVPSSPPQDGNTAEEAAATGYRDAKGLLDSGRLDEARTAFVRFLEQYPEHPLADNALYWIGETWYAKSLWLKAARVFGEVVSRFPRANKVPDAMYKTALCYQNLGELQLARDVLRQLIRLYPSTSTAEQARDRLATLEEAR